MLLQAVDSGRYCWDTVSTSCMTMSVSSTLRVTSAASRLRFSSVVMIVSSSRMRPFTSFRAWSSDFSSCRRRSWNSPAAAQGPGSAAARPFLRPRGTAWKS